MTNIAFTPAEKDHIASKIQKYLDDELQIDIGKFDAQFLLDFFTDEIGGYFYNKALEDAQILLRGKVDELTDAFYDIEKPVDYQGK